MEIVTVLNGIPKRLLLLGHSGISRLLTHCSKNSLELSRNLKTGYL